MLAICFNNNTEKMRVKESLWACAAAAVALFASCGSEKNNSYTLSGVVPAGVDAEWIYMYSGLDQMFLDSTRISNGSFQFEGVADTTSLVFLHPGNENQYPAVGWNVLLEKGDIVVDTLSQFASGTPLNDGMKEWMEEIERISRTGSETDIKSFFDMHWDEHKNDVVGPFVLSMVSVVLEFNYVDSLLSQVPAEVRSNPLVKGFVDQCESNRAMQPGKIFTDVEIRTLEGDTARLSDYIGKGDYVLVDMWASWCGPCRQSMPELQKVVSKYSKKIKVLGIALSDKPDDTRRAMDVLKIKWPVLSDEQALVAQTYGFNAIPYMILFAPDGTIVERGFHVEDLETLLEKTL